MKKKAVIVIGLLLIVVIISCQNQDSIEFDRYYSTGSVVYQQHCQNCHGERGEGLQGLIPPLTDSVYLKANKTSLACFVNHGLKAKISVLNREFEGQMPANNLAPIELAEVLTYVTNSFGNKQGIVSLDMVNADMAGCK